MYIEALLLFSLFALILYIFAIRDDNFIRNRDRPTIKSKRKVINWYAWKGPMFIEDFASIDEKKCNTGFPDNENRWCSKDYRGDHQACSDRAKTNCRIPSLTREESWRNEYHNCSYWMRGPNKETGDLGNYKQCTNNNLDVPNHLKCVNQTCQDMDVCPPKDRVSHFCFKRSYDKCMRGKGHKIF